jgi:hypothetical protein
MSGTLGGVVEQNKAQIKAAVDKENSRQQAEAANAKSFQEKQKSKMKNSQRQLLGTNPSTDSNETLGAGGM